MEKSAILLFADELYSTGDFTIGKHAEHSPMNALIHNYKKKPTRKGQPDWPFKEESIKVAADRFRISILQTIGIRDRFKKAILVPTPPSHAKNSPEYDDRNLNLLTYLNSHSDIRELILQKESREPLHKSRARNPKELEMNYYLNPSTNLDLGDSEVWLFDDVLTKGTHFRAMSDFLRSHYPNVKTVGFYIARSVYP